MKIVAVLGSPRENSNTNYLADLALEEASKLGIETVKIVVKDYKINPCLGHDECWGIKSCLLKDDVERLVCQLYEADAVILASPVHYYGPTTHLKVFIDRNVWYRRHKVRMKAKYAGIIVVAGGGGVEETVNNLTKFISMSSNIKADDVLRATGIAQTAGAIKTNTAAIEQARKLGADLTKRLTAK